MTTQSASETPNRDQTTQPDALFHGVPDLPPSHQSTSLHSFWTKVFVVQFIVLETILAPSFLSFLFPPCLAQCLEKPRVPSHHFLELYILTRTRQTAPNLLHEQPRFCFRPVPPRPLKFPSCNMRTGRPCQIFSLFRLNTLMITETDPPTT